MFLKNNICVHIFSLKLGHRQTSVFHLFIVNTKQYFILVHLYFINYIYWLLLITNVGKFNLYSCNLHYYFHLILTDLHLFSDVGIQAISHKTC